MLLLPLAPLLPLFLNRVAESLVAEVVTEEEYEEEDTEKSSPEYALEDDPKGERILGAEAEPTPLLVPIFV